MRLAAYWQNIQLDLRMLLFFLVLLAVYRLLFMFGMAGFMGPAADWSDILLANLTGLRLSLKSAGIIALLGFLLATLPALVNPRLNWGRARLVVGALANFLLTVLFIARFPYYEEFHMTYSMQVFQGLHDDKLALLGTMVSQYGLIQWLIVAVLVDGILTLALRYLLALPVLHIARPGKAVQSGITAFLLTFMVVFFCRWGGGYSYATGINWEHCAITRDDFLNECILDDIQGLYRAVQLEKRMQAGDVYGVDKAYAYSLTADEADRLLTHRTAGPKLAKPRHIFIVMEETGMQWPLLPKYEKMHLADGLKSLINSEQGYYTRNFMPNGEFTSVAITGMITGLPDVNIRVNYQPRTYHGLYATAMANPFHELGYQVDFWYGGAPSWDAVSRLALAQGFDHFYGYPQLGAPKTTPWGTDDGYLFASLFRHLEDEEPTVHVIMTTTNHPPYNLDLQKEGFDLESAEKLVRELIPEEDKPAALARELGHYWYMDKVVTDFVQKAQERYPDSLFVITGDHAVRSNPGPRPSLLEYQSVPLVLYGQGINKDILPADAVGGCTGIVPTILELIAPQGFVYKSVAPPLGQWPAAFNRSTFLTDKAIGRIEDEKTELLPGVEQADFAAEREKMLPFLRKMRTLAWWQIMVDQKEEK